MADDKCLGTLYLELSRLNDDVDKANAKLGTLGKGISFTQDYRLTSTSLAGDITKINSELKKITFAPITNIIDLKQLKADVATANAELAKLTTPTWPTGSGGGGGGGGGGGKGPSVDSVLKNYMLQVERIRQQLQNPSTKDGLTMILEAQRAALNSLINDNTKFTQSQRDAVTATNAFQNALRRTSQSIGKAVDKKDSEELERVKQLMIDIERINQKM